MKPPLVASEGSTYGLGVDAEQINRGRLRVCFISPNAYGLLRPASGLPFGGAEVQITSLGRELARDPRFEILLLTRDGNRIGREQEDGMSIVLDTFCGPNKACDPVREPGVAGHLSNCLARCPGGMASFVRIPVRAWYASRRWLKSVSFVRRLVHRMREWREAVRWASLFRSIGADVYVMRCAALQVGYMRRACALLRRRFVYMVAHEMDVTGEYAASHGTVGRIFEEALQRADAVVCQHADQVRMIRMRYGREPRLIRSLCPFPVSACSGAARATILWVARVESWKQPDLFLDLASRMPEHTFVMVGAASQIEPYNLSRLSARASDLPNLRFLAGVPFAHTSALFEEAKIFVNTSMAEGFPNTFLQAAACGTPTVSWGVNPEGLLDKYEMGYCADGNWARFEGYVRLLCEDAALRGRMGENARRYVTEHHSPAVIAREFGDLCLALGNKRKVAALQAQSVPTT